MTCQKHKHACVDNHMLALLSSCSNSPAQIHFTLYAHTDVLINACKPPVRMLLCHCGLTADSGTSIQQGFDSDMLVSIAACMYQLLLHLPYMCASAHCIVACPYLQSQTCIVIIILMGQA